MLKVALFVHSMGGGGMARVMAGLACGFADRGVDVDLVVVKAEGEFLDLVPANVRLIDLKARKTVVSLLKFLLYLRRERASAIISMPLRTNIVALMSKMIVRGNIRVIARQDTTLGEQYVESSFRQRRMWEVFKLLLPTADHVVAVSDGVAKISVAQFLVPPQKL